MEFYGRVVKFWGNKVEHNNVILLIYILTEDCDVELKGVPKKNLNIYVGNVRS